MLAIGGVHLHVEQYGSGPPLFLLHGLGSSARDWEYQIPALAPHFRILAPDFRGHGLSDRQGPYRIETWAEDVVAIADQLGIKRFSVLGYSMGGAVAQQIAIDHPERVERLVLANTLPSFKPERPYHYFMLWTRLAIIATLGPAQLAKVVARKVFPAPEHAELRHKVATRNAGNDPQVYRASIRALTGWSVIERLSQLTAPTYVMAAEKDYFSTAYLNEFVAQLPNCIGWQVFSGTRHGLPLEAPERFNARVLDVLLRR